MAAVTVGTFGPVLTASMPFGFFWAIKNAAVPGGLRVEAIFAMVWQAVDLTVVSLLMRAALLLAKRAGWAAAAVTAAIVAAGTAAIGFLDQDILNGITLWVTAGLLLGLPAVILLTRPPRAAPPN
jgi:hypothetical protein